MNCDGSHVVYLWELLLPQILRHCRLKVHGVALVQAENVASLLDLHVAVDQDEFTDGLMGGRERRNSKTLIKALVSVFYFLLLLKKRLTGSSMKQLTPLPVESTIMVALP